MSLRLNGSTSGYSEIDAPAIAGNNTLVLPTTNGSANQLLKNGSTPGVLEYALTTLDSSGNLGSIASINGGPLAGFRNRIINGNFDFWQRGTSFTGDEYGADRWGHARVGTTHTATRQAFTLGQTAVPGEPTYFCRTVVVTSSGASNYAILVQRIEDVRTFAGQQVTVSFWAKVDSTKNIAVELVQVWHWWLTQCASSRHRHYQGIYWNQLAEGNSHSNSAIYQRKNARHKRRQLSGFDFLV
jgi:hypothetical protein